MKNWSKPEVPHEKTAPDGERSREEPRVKSDGGQNRRVRQMKQESRNESRN
jgi:hypothetical protein